MQDSRPGRVVTKTCLVGPVPDPSLSNATVVNATAAPGAGKKTYPLVTSNDCIDTSYFGNATRANVLVGVEWLTDDGACVCVGCLWLRLSVCVSSIIITRHHNN